MDLNKDIEEVVKQQKPLTRSPRSERMLKNSLRRRTFNSSNSEENFRELKLPEERNPSPDDRSVEVATKEPKIDIIQPLFDANA